MRCPYCREEIHDQALKCPHCQRLLVPKPGWRRKPAGAAAARRAGGSRNATVEAVDAEQLGEVDVEEAAPARPLSRGRHTARSGRAPMIFAVVVLMAVSAVVGYMVGRTVTGAPIGFVSGDVERISGLEARLAQQAQEIERLRRRATQAEFEGPTPSEARLIAALRSCDQAFAMLVDREAALFSDQLALATFVRLSNQCLAPIERSVEIPA